MINIEKPSHTKIKVGDSFLFILTGSIGPKVFATKNLCYLGDKKSRHHNENTNFLFRFQAIYNKSEIFFTEKANLY